MKAALILSVAPLALCAASQAAQKLCNTLPSSLPAKVVQSASGNLSAAYQEAVGKYYDIANRDDVPACVLFPTSAADVSTAMKLLHAAPTVPFALKSGGHNWNRGYSSTNGGVLITFRPFMNYTKPSTDLKTAEVGPGSRWREVMQTLDPMGRAAVGGRSADVGVGGYITHGGISYLTSQYGFASDNVVNFEIVSANGTIMNVNKTSNPDLFFSLRGGGNLFGVVTKYTLNIYPMGKVWGGAKYYSAEKGPELFSAISDYVANYNETKSALIPTIAWLGALNGSAIFTIFYFWDGPQAPPANVFAKFNAIEAFQDQTKVQTYPEMLEHAAVDLTFRTTDAISSLPNLPCDKMTEFLNWHYSEASNQSTIYDPTIGFTLFSMALQPIPAALQRQNYAKGPAALSTNPAHGDKLWIEYSLGWQNATCDEVCPQKLISMVNTAKLHMQQKYGSIKPTNYKSGDLSYVPYNPLFFNDAQDGQPVYESYGQKTFAKLKSVRQKYDPDNVFLLQTGGFKLW